MTARVPKVRPTTVRDFGTNRIEMREWISRGYRSAANGRSTVTIECPFCHAMSYAAVWSLRGGGKRCEGIDCGAFFDGYGNAARLHDEFRLPKARRT